LVSPEVQGGISPTTAVAGGGGGFLRHWGGGRIGCEEKEKPVGGCKGEYLSKKPNMLLKRIVDGCKDQWSSKKWKTPTGRRGVERIRGERMHKILELRSWSRGERRGGGGGEPEERGAGGRHTKRAEIG